MLLRSLLFIVALIGALTVQAAPEVPDDYVKVFQTGLPTEKQKAAETLAWAGISSPRLFDVVEQEAIKSLPMATDKGSANYTAWMTKALAFSGNEKYRATIQKVIAEAPHNRLKKHAMNALRDLDKYAKLNPMIAPKAWPEFEHPSLNQRLLNMLNSNDAELMRLAAKRIHYTGNYDRELLKALSSKIESNYREPMDNNRMDAIAWLCRALAGSRSVEYRPMIEKVAGGAIHKKLRKQAMRFLSQY